MATTMMRTMMSMMMMMNNTMLMSDDNQWQPCSGNQWQPVTTSDNQWHPVMVSPLHDGFLSGMHICIKAYAEIISLRLKRTLSWHLKWKKTVLELRIYLGTGGFNSHFSICMSSMTHRPYFFLWSTSEQPPLPCTPAKIGLDRSCLEPPCSGEYWKGVK